jgi:hypothetical protein
VDGGVGSVLKCVTVCSNPVCGAYTSDVAVIRRAPALNMKFPNAGMWTTKGTIYYMYEASIFVIDSMGATQLIATVPRL